MNQATLYAPRLSLSLVREDGPGYAPATRLNDTATAARFLTSPGLSLDQEPAEVMGALLLDARHRLLGVTMPYRGTINRAAVEPRGVLVPALLANASGVVLFHNHPSGDPSASVEDVTFTRRFSAACDVLGLSLLDHLIIGERGSFVSLKERGGW